MTEQAGFHFQLLKEEINKLVCYVCFISCDKWMTNCCGQSVWNKFKLIMGQRKGLTVQDRGAAGVMHSSVTAWIRGSPPKTCGVGVDVLSPARWAAALCLPGVSLARPCSWNLCHGHLWCLAGCRAVLGVLRDSGRCSLHCPLSPTAMGCVTPVLGAG